MIFYLPAIVFVVFYGTLAIIGEDVVLPIFIIWSALFIISGFILGKGLSLGSLFGILPAIHMAVIGIRNTGQIFNEIPVAIMIFLFFIVCGYGVYRNNTKVNRIT